TYVASIPPVLTIDSLSRGQICHETGHLLGFQHEHQRIDRDSYITVNFANICCGNGFLYDVDTNSTPSGPYDFESVMHYGRNLFAIDPNVNTAEPKPAYAFKYQNRIGNFCLSV